MQPHPLELPSSVSSAVASKWRQQGRGVLVMLSCLARSLSGESVKASLQWISDIAGKLGPQHSEVTHRVPAQSSGPQEPDAAETSRTGGPQGQRQHFFKPH